MLGKNHDCFLFVHIRFLPILSSFFAMQTANEKKKRGKKIQLKLNKRTIAYNTIQKKRVLDVADFFFLYQNSKLLARF